MIVLDASALLAFLFEESGGDSVAAQMRGAALSTVSYSEVLTRMGEREVPAELAKATVARAQVDLVDFDADHAERAAALRPLTRHLGLSLGDRACLALAQALDAPVLTADRAWADLDVGIDIRLVR